MMPGGRKIDYKASSALPIVCVSVFCLAVTYAGARQAWASDPDAQVEAKAAAKDTRLPSITRASFGYHSFAASSMRNTYDHAVTTTSVELWPGKLFDASVEIGWMTAQGTPLKRNSDWVTSDSWIKMKVLTFGVNAIHRLRNTAGKGFFEPYVGAGPILYLGSERVSVEASRVRAGIEEGFRDELLAIRASVGGAAMLGTTVRVIRDVRFVAEVRGVLTSSSGTADLNEEKDKEAFEAFLYRVAERPNFSFTGWTGYVGFQWNWGEPM